MRRSAAVIWAHIYYFQPQRYPDMISWYLLVGCSPPPVWFCLDMSQKREKHTVGTYFAKSQPHQTTSTSQDCSWCSRNFLGVSPLEITQACLHCMGFAQQEVGFCADFGGFLLVDLITNRSKVQQKVCGSWVYQIIRASLYMHIFFVNQKRSHEERRTVKYIAGIRPHTFVASTSQFLAKMPEHCLDPVLQ